MKKVIAAVCVCLLSMLCVTGIGYYAVASVKRVPIYSVERDDNYVAISFDAAWGADKTQKIMDVCDQYGVKATFFLVEFWVEKFPEMVMEIDARGFEIGTHSATHPKMSTLTAEQCVQELKSSCKAIFDLTGKPITLFRPPFGDYNNTLLNVCDNMGLYPIQWSVDSLDWKGLSATEIAQRVQKARSGDIILCHNNSDHIVEALPLIFEWARIAGIKFCPIGELIYKNDYTIKSDGTQVKNATN